MMHPRRLALLAAMAGNLLLAPGPAADRATAEEAKQDLEDLGDATAKRGEVLEEYGKALRDRLKGKDPGDNLDDAREERAKLGEAADLMAGTGREAPDPTELDVQSLIRTPDRWLGRDLQLEVEVQDVITDRAFTLETDLSGPGSDLLVLSVAPLPGLTVEGKRWSLKRDKIVLRGRMQFARPAELERELGWDLAPDLEAAIDGKLVLVASALVQNHAD